MDCVTNEIIEGLKIASPLFAVLISLIIWADQKKHQKEQSIINADVQKEISEINARNNVSLKEREFELKFYEEIIKKRIADYVELSKCISEIMSGDPFTTEQRLDEAILKMQKMLHQALSLDYHIGAVWQVVMTRMTSIYRQALTTMDRDDFISQHYREITHHLGLLLLEINYGLLGVDDLEKSKKDNKTRILDMLHRGKELGFPVLFSSHQQELSETQRIQEAKEETKQ